MSTTQTETETITTSFPLGLFSNATMSGPISKTKPAKASTTSHKVEQKSEQRTENVAPIDPKSKGWMKGSTWTIAQARSKS